MKTTVRIYSSDQIVKRKEMDDLMNNMQEMHKKEFEEIKTMLAEMKVKRTSDPTMWQKMKGYFKKEPQIAPLEVKAFDGIGSKDKVGG